MLWHLFFSGFALSLSLCLDLGMVNVAIVREGVQRGFWPSFLIGVGSSFGDLTYAVLATTGVALLLGIPEVRWALWVGGTIMLLYFAALMIRAAMRPKSMDAGDAAANGQAAPRRSSLRSFLWGWGLAIASPTAILWFATVGGSVVAKSPVQGALALASFLAGFFSASILWSLGMALLASTSGKRLGPTFVRAISIVSAALFLYFAVDVFLDGYRSFVAPL
ncbi:lysine transporter LysE [Paenibacillus antri]|uniref:Lysine transporter LysE n=1 Tax=Paenibacillus antri TaxID=2582848 RepID=A0A5R9G4A9_9BACL|nr:LysE family transporter [Paenibacillus antri]TLS51202.1 lysine transporter LysE [Paenibacillus antri]